MRVQILAMKNARAFVQTAVLDVSWPRISARRVVVIERISHDIRGPSIGTVELAEGNVIRGAEDEEGCYQKIDIEKRGTLTLLLYLPARAERAYRGNRPLYDITFRWRASTPIRARWCEYIVGCHRIQMTGTEIWRNTVWKGVRLWNAGMTTIPHSQGGHVFKGVVLYPGSQSNYRPNVNYIKPQ